MNRIRGKLVLITGASAGIGEACARRCARDGADVALWARRTERLDRLAAELRDAFGVNVYTAVVDVRDRASVFTAADALCAEVGAPHVLVNNAGLASGLDRIHEGDPEDWDRMIDTNLKGLLHVARAFLPRMVEAGRGHVVNIGSIAGHLNYPRGNVYSATKFAVRGLTDGINLDMAGTPIRVSSVDPGLTETEFSLVRFHGDEERASKAYRGIRALSGDDVADAVAYVINAPDHVNVLGMVIMPTAQRNFYVTNREA